MKTDDNATVGDLQKDLEGNKVSMKDHFLENSTVKSNGVREVSKAGFESALLSHGVSPVEVKKVTAVMEAATSAAADLAADDLVNKIKEMNDDDLKNDELRRGLSSTVRIPTSGGRSDITVHAEKSHPVPYRGDGERPENKIVHGGIRTSINATSRIDKALPAAISERIKDALKIK